jgi:hypothetical protein
MSRPQNEILADIVVASGGTVTNPSNRNSLYNDWKNAVESPPAVEYMTRLNGVSSVIQVPNIPVSAGSTIELQFFAPPSLQAQTRLLMDSPSGSALPRCFIEQNSNGTVAFNTSAYSEMRLDGVVISSMSVAFPSDENFHTFLGVLSVNSEIGWLGSLFNGASLLANFPITKLKINDGSVWDFPLNEPWSSDIPRVAFNSGSGANAEYINTVESDVEVRP